MSKLEKKKTAKSKKAAKRRRSLIIKAIILLIMVAVLSVGIVFLVKELSGIYKNNQGNQGGDVTLTPTGEPDETDEEKEREEEEK